MEVGGVRRLNFLFANLTTPIKTARDARYPEEKCRPLKTRDRTNCCTSDLISKLMVIQFSESGSRGGIKMSLIIYRSDRELNSSSAPHPRLTLNNETRLSSNKKNHTAADRNKTDTKRQKAATFVIHVPCGFPSPNSAVPVPREFSLFSHRHLIRFPLEIIRLN
jgi:hypothetical protein